MINILLVEDDANKRQAIADAILSVEGISPDGLSIAVDVVGAKTQLKSRGFDLLLLDIHLPNRADRNPEPGGGLEVLRWLKTRGKEHRPPYIIGTTVYDASLELAQSEFNNFIWTLVAFSFSDNGWRDKLISTVKVIVDQIVPPYPSDGVSFKSDALLVAALDSPELSSLLELPVTWQPVKVRFDDSRYFRGQLKTGRRLIDIVCVAASDKGLSSAAIATTKAIQAFRPELVIMPGMCAGVRGRVGMGDVIVGDPTWDWGSGKTRIGSDGEEFFHPAQYQMRLDETLRVAAMELKSDPDLLRQPYDAFLEAKPDVVPKVHIAAFASGAAVLQSWPAVKRIIEHHKDLRAIDMEVYSVMYACHIASNPRPKCLVAKAVCDFGDEEKGDSFQKFAAYMSANFVLKALCKLFETSE